MQRWVFYASAPVKLYFSRRAQRALRFVKMLIPQDAVVNRLAVLETILSQIPVGVILFDRGFNPRKVFKSLLSAGQRSGCCVVPNPMPCFTLCPNPKNNRNGDVKKSMASGFISLRCALVRFLSTVNPFRSLRRLSAPRCVISPSA